MKTLEIKQTEVKVSDKENGGLKDADYKDLIMACLDNIPQGGFTMSEMKDRKRIQDALDTSNGELVFEDSDANKLKKIVETMKWGNRSGDLISFADDVANMSQKD